MTKRKPFALLLTGTAPSEMFTDTIRSNVKAAIRGNLFDDESKLKVLGVKDTRDVVNAARAAAYVLYAIRAAEVLGRIYRGRTDNGYARAMYEVLAAITGDNPRHWKVCKEAETIKADEFMEAVAGVAAELRKDEPSVDRCRALLEPIEQYLKGWR